VVNGGNAVAGEVFVPQLKENFAEYEKLRKKAGNGKAKPVEAIQAVAEIKAKFPALYDGLAAQVGDLVKFSEQALAECSVGGDYLLRSAIERKVAALKADLAGPTPTPLERLLIDRIGACWLAMQYFETIYAQGLAKSTSWEGDAYRQSRLDRVQARYLAAITALARVRRLQLVTVQVNIAEKQVNIGAAVG
jgi:hypothetical protein